MNNDLTKRAQDLLAVMANSYPGPWLAVAGDYGEEPGDFADILANPYKASSTEDMQPIAEDVSMHNAVAIVHAMDHAPLIIAELLAEVIRLQKVADQMRELGDFNYCVDDVTCGNEWFDGSHYPELYAELTKEADNADRR